MRCSFAVNAPHSILVELCRTEINPQEGIFRLLKPHLLVVGAVNPLRASVSAGQWLSLCGSPHTFLPVAVVQAVGVAVQNYPATAFQGNLVKPQDRDVLNYSSLLF